MPAVLCLLDDDYSAAISQQKELLEKPQTRRAFKAMENNTSSLFVHRHADSILMSSSSSTLSSTSTFGGASRRLLKFDFDKQLFISKVYERWIQGSSDRALWEQQPESDNQRMGAVYVETKEKFTVDPVETGEKFIADGNVLDVVETREKFSILPAVITEEKFGIVDTPVETREKFLANPIDASEKVTVYGEESITDEMDLLTPKYSNNSSIKDKWKPLRLISPAHKKSDSQKRSLAIDSALREEYRRRQQYDYKALIIGSESRLHILTAAKTRDKKREYTSQELSKYQEVVLKNVRKYTHMLIKEMHREQINPEARYLWAYVDLIEEYYYDDDGNCSAPVEELDARFFGALEAVLQDPLIADLIKRCSSEQEGVLPKIAE